MVPVTWRSWFLLPALALLAIAGPAAAHVPVATPATTLEPGPAAGTISTLIAAPTPSAWPWYLVPALGLVAVTAGRRPRRALVVALALLLCVFAFENALHSVHHGFDAQQQEACTIAAAAAHLTAVQVDDVGLFSVALAVIGRVEAAPPVAATTRSLGPDRGRAPPFPSL
jgi:hypothetical protein